LGKSKKMNYLRILLFLCISAAVISCQDDDRQRRAETLRTIKQNDSILKIISNNWKFDVPPLRPEVALRVSTWNEWQQFNNELAQKPTGSLRAYRQKTKTLVTRAEKLRDNIPLFFNKPQVRSRIGVIITKIKSLYTYINLEVIPDKKVTALLAEVTSETVSLENQLEIPKEFGEEEMLRALDTVRHANPGALPQASQPQPIQDGSAKKRKLTKHPIQ
jgi:hypothetical protein